MSSLDGGLTLDSGALIALERPKTERARRVTALIARCLARTRVVTVPAIVFAESWRAPPTRRLPKYSPLHGVTHEPLHPSLAKLAGWAIGQVSDGPSVADAIVVASAAQRGDIVLTSDLDDLEQLIGLFPSVRLLGV